ncbi:MULTISPECIES: RNA polymerase-binding protein RbpA [unclassified Actinobaculum]|uniref:RNA polymerase-binding protein RbpA n=1 Tax=unclassified Actinobaculum TaxID=2609299 RepID=UPI000D52785F|nr:MULTISPECIES: RNA polymerase-binding protein RbpA [unclassified Actinobaculum]AWE42400.1 electron transporter [Actinobaculum sp. 313]RTE48386.1 RNA polymerase-binding protein RbpA [Actinobaculum sp. 352]
MAERSLRGMKIGANSLETDEGVAFVDRKQVMYDCPNGHEFGVAMALDAEPPATWECRCGQEGKLRDQVELEEEKPVKPPRTHWDMLMERRTEDELQVLLDERLELLRSGKLRMRRRRK